MESNVVLNESYAIIINLLATLVFGCSLLLLKDKKDKVNIKPYFIIFILFVVATSATFIVQSKYGIVIAGMSIYTIFNFISLIVLMSYKETDKFFTKVLIFLTIFIVYLGYNLYTPFNVRQHDGRDFIQYLNGGHLGYIGYIVFEGKLPDMDPQAYWCFYNPPLFHLLSAGIVKITYYFSNSYEISLETVQLSSMIYALIFDIYVYKILKKLDIKESTPFLLFFIAFSPAIVFMSGSLNNDMLSVCLSTMAIYYTIKWYDSEKLKDLILIAFTISLAIMTKISAALVSIPIGVVFLYKLVKNKDMIKKLIIDYIIFAIIALPIGLWFPIRNMVKFHIPPTYVQSVELDNEANISKYSTFERFFTIGPATFEDKNVNMTREHAEYNVFFTTLKSFVVDEYIDYEDSETVEMYLDFLFKISIVISILFLVNYIYLIIKRDKENNMWLYFFSFLFVLEVLSYIKFCFDFPFTFTMNFRYIVPTLLTFAVVLGKITEKNKVLDMINSIVLTLFIVLSLALFIAI